MTQTKTCEGCGERFSRPADTAQLRWEARKYCSQRCGFSTGGRNSFIGGGITADASARASAQLGSDALRTRILNMFARTANRHHVTLEEAARMHLCPAKTA